MLVYKISSDRIEYILEKLTVRDKKWVFRDYDSAYEYANIFMILNKDYYSAITSAVMYRRVGDYIKHALEQGYITRDDLYTTDKEVIDKINKHLSIDDKLNVYWKRMNDSAGYENNPNNYDVEVFCKSRIVDPLCWHNGEIKRVSEIKPDWKKIVKEEQEPKEYFIKFLD